MEIGRGRGGVAEGLHSPPPPPPPHTMLTQNVYMRGSALPVMARCYCWCFYSLGMLRVSSKPLIGIPFIFSFIGIL